MKIETSLTIQNLNSAKALIEKATTSQLKEIIGRAEALRVYATQAKKGLEIQNQCAEIKLRAERRIGERLAVEVKAGNPQLLQDETIGLKELGIERIQSHRWQAVASLPEKEFEKHIEEVKKSNEELTTIGVIKLARELITDKRINDERKISITDIDLRKGDFKKVLSDLKDIDVIITDPPYPKEYLNCFSELGEYAAVHLKKDGFLVCYSGHFHLPEVIKRLSEHLTYVWIFALYHAGKTQLVKGVNIMAGWKPILIFSKGKKKMRFPAYDVVISEKRE